ncbi:hypothetical protein HAX54_010432 [Datura stramonium]|uniref:Uncharacterized protein n=1 Tax=Datura stramonium TaxID=4076 RepID=A0ABS8TIZ3_DATST|nr:hypothetical protein [Datura stramonium]
MKAPVKLAKAIPSMTQLAMKKSMQLARDKLKGLCTTVEVLENKAITLRKEVAVTNGPPSSKELNPFSLGSWCLLAPEEPRSPPGAIEAVARHYHAVFPPRGKFEINSSWKVRDGTVSRSLCSAFTSVKRWEDFVAHPDSSEGARVCPWYGADAP